MSIRITYSTIDSTNCTLLMSHVAPEVIDAVLPFVNGPRFNRNYGNLYADIDNLACVVDAIKPFGLRIACAPYENHD